MPGPLRRGGGHANGGPPYEASTSCLVDTHGGVKGNSRVWGRRLKPPLAQLQPPAPSTSLSIVALVGMKP